MLQGSVTLTASSLLNDLSTSPAKRSLVVQAHPQQFDAGLTVAVRAERQHEPVGFASRLPVGGTPTV
jgi:hypothetical protein